MSLSFIGVGYISLILNRVNSPFFTGPTYSQSPTIKMSSLIDQIGLLLLQQQIFGVILYLDKGNSSNDNVPLYWILQSQGVGCFRCRLCRTLILVPQIGIGGFFNKLYLRLMVYLKPKNIFYSANLEQPLDFSSFL